MKEASTQNSKKNSQPIIQNIIVKPVRRTSQDISTWRQAMQAAEAELPRRVLLYDLYEDLLLDGHLASIIEKRIMAVTNSPLVFTLNKKSVDAVEELQEKEWFENLLVELMNAKFWSHSLVEFFYNENGELTNELVPRKNVEQKRGLILKQQGDSTGENYRENKARKPWLIEAGTWKNLGILLSTAQYVIYKRGNFGDWAQYAELFGMPWVTAEYNTYDEKTRQQLEKALETAGGSPRIMYPEGTKIDIKFATSAGNGDLYKVLKDACNEAMSVRILGNTMTTLDTAGSGYAQGKIHSAVEQGIAMNDRRSITRILNDKLNPILAMHGYPVGEGKWSYRQEDDIDLLGKKIIIDMQVSEKVPVADDYFYDTYKVPKPDNYDELREEKEAARQAAVSSMTSMEENTSEEEEPAAQKTSKNPEKKTKKLADRFSTLLRFFS